MLMRSKITWLALTAAIVSTGIACSDDPAETSMDNLPNQPGAGGSAGMASTTPAPPSTPSASAGSGGSESTPPPPLAGGQNQNGAAAGTRDAGAGGSNAEVADAGGLDAPDAAPGGGDPPPADAVGFSDVFPLLVASCGGCHGATAPGARPRFAQAGNEAASLTAARAMAPQGVTVAARIIVRAVTARNMPPACNGQALGTGQCLDAGEAALLQAWVDQGLQP
jgi:hypothetical protein